MKYLFIALLCAMSSSIFSQETATISKNQETLTWVGKAASSGYEPEGTLKVLSAKIAYTETQIEKLFIVVDMQSLYHENKQLRKHLKEEDFFSAKAFPVATFVLTEKAKITNGKTTLNGEMTIKGVTKNENIQIECIFNTEAISITFNHEMDRTSYGVNFNSPTIFTSMKENLIADAFKLSGSLNFNKK